jgi:hypothetical protein
VEHALYAAQGASHRAAVADVAVDALEVEIRDRRVRRARLNGQHHVVPPLGNQPRHVRADEASRAGDEDRGQVAGRLAL